jgi:hypothetical protein
MGNDADLLIFFARLPIILLGLLWKKVCRLDSWQNCCFKPLRLGPKTFFPAFSYSNSPTSSSLPSISTLLHTPSTSSQPPRSPHQICPPDSLYSTHFPSTCSPPVQTDSTRSSTQTGSLQAHHQCSSSPSSFVPL